ncbi:MAG TPA: glycine cleavage T C-terminal barrel domain-containing protein, partial [Marmoricola sp.]|nr:glycine cleavage T C-terminal barrel domain-containing protein [Marmoricola sp.]
GLTFACKLNTDIDFIGREVVIAAKANGPRRRLVSFVAEDPEVMMWGGELILRDGLPSGQISSAAWGAQLKASVGLGYLWSDADSVNLDWIREGRYQVNVGGTLVDVRVSTRALYDPNNERIRN